VCASYIVLSTKNIDPADPNAVVSADMDNFCDCRLPLLLSVSIRFPGFALFEVEMFGRDEREGGASSSCVRENCRRTLLARKRRFQREFVDRSEGEAKNSLVSLNCFFKKIEIFLLKSNKVIFHKSTLVYLTCRWHGRGISRERRHTLGKKICSSQRRALHQLREAFSRSPKTFGT